MITLERPVRELAPLGQGDSEKSDKPTASRPRDPQTGRFVPSLPAQPTARGFGRKLTATLVLGGVLAMMAGSAFVLDAGIAVGVQTKAVQLHQQWAVMRANGIADSDLAPLEQEWAYSQKIKYMGAGTVFWNPGASAILDRWESAAIAIYSRSIRLNRAGAVAADQSLRVALGTEPRAQLKARVDALASATTPRDFALLRTDWDLEARLVPLDRRIAAAAGNLANQVLQAKSLAIRGDPAPDTLTRADLYSRMDALGRMAHAELLTRNLGSVGSNLQGRLDAAGVTQQAFGHAANQINAASVYGLELSSYQARIESNHGAYSNAASVVEFNAITADLNQIAAGADNAVYVALTTTHVIGGVAFIYQNHPLSCEEAATSMALTHQGIYVSQDQILAELGADRRAAYSDASGTLRWGNPYATFVGNVNGSESNLTGYGTYYPPLVRIAKAHGARLLAYGSMSAGTIYARLIAGHPVVAFATWDWAWHPRHDYLSYDGQWIPFIGPAAASHVYALVGVSPGSVLVNDPIRGQYWLSKASFQAGYSDFNEAIVFA
jgi:uncharacterized protein YvpB